MQLNKAEPTTITGSIGIFGIIPDFSGLIGKTGVTLDAVKTNTHANFPSVTQPMDEAEKRALQTYIERGYQLFLKRCAEGRNMPIDTITRFAEGRVWSGANAKEIGLIDELGNLGKAVELAADYAQISEYAIENYPKEKDIISLLFEDPLSQLKQAGLPLGKEEMHTLLFLQRLKDIEPRQARLPFEVNTLF
jgi:protease-4